MGVPLAHPISPELVLVCPELRDHTLPLLPTRDPELLFEVRPRPAPEIRGRPRLVLVEPEPEPAPRAPLTVALAAYATEALVLGALRGAALTAVIAAVALLLSR